MSDTGSDHQRFLEYKAQYERDQAELEKQAYSFSPKGQSGSVKVRQFMPSNSRHSNANFARVSFAGDNHDDGQSGGVKQITPRSKPAPAGQQP